MELTISIRGPELAARITLLRITLEQIPSHSRAMERYVERLSGLLGFRGYHLLKTYHLKGDSVFARANEAAIDVRLTNSQLQSLVHDADTILNAPPPQFSNLGDLASYSEALATLCAIRESLDARREIDEDPTVTVQQGDTLEIISARAYGTPDRWMAIATRNNIDFPYTLISGQILSLPRLR